MSGFFSIDSPLMRTMSKVADLMILNLLVIVTCIPVITIGASLSAMHYVLIKINRNEGTSVAVMFFKSFKENFAQATILWFINIAGLFLFAYDVYIFFFANNTLPVLVLIFVLAVGVLFVMTSMYFYPLQARFINPVPKTVRNAFFVMVLNFPKSVLTVLIYMIPIGLLILTTYFIPIVFLFGISVPGFFAVKLYSKVFAKIEPKEEEVTEDMDFHIQDDSVN